MQRVGETFTVGGAEFVIEQIDTGGVHARCMRPDPTNALAYQPHQLYYFGDSPIPARPVYGRSPVQQAAPAWSLLGLLLGSLLRR